MDPPLEWRPDINPCSMMYNCYVYSIVNFFLGLWGNSYHSEIGKIETSGQEIEFKLILNPGRTAEIIAMLKDIKD